ncbi:MAG TPA: aminotransferase class I/II-fold pyridoxal phosphate-dependent enzyme [Thermoleophilaceae bacterium]|nr:aminotransferase class I/II-fold pyridoxal phosphate-dependent enzyme [Thermoleophilaceae bacterium]
MGLLDYYRQFEDMTEEEVNRGLRERRAREKAMELERVSTCDLSRTEWPDFPDSEVVNASVFAARRGINDYPDRHATEARTMLASRHGVDPSRVVLGNGATELLQATAGQLLSDGDELVTPWPSYPLYPLMAQRVRARPVAIDLSGAGRADPEALVQAAGERARALVLCNPNDPTGTYLESSTVEWMLEELPEQVHLLLDEAYIQYQDREDEDAAVRLTDRHPRLVVFRTFSKIYGLSGIRAGYAVGAAEAAPILKAIAPVLGVNALTQAAVVQSLKIGDPEIDRRRKLVRGQRRRLQSAIHDLPVDAPETQANFAWLAAPGLTGVELAARLERASVVVAPGGPLGDEDHVRVSIRGPASTERILSALRKAFDGR